MIPGVLLRVMRVCTLCVARMLARVVGVNDVCALFCCCNLVGVILTTAKYKSKYGDSFPTPKNLAIYDSTVTKDTVPFEWAKK